MIGADLNQDDDAEYEQYGGKESIVTKEMILAGVAAMQASYGLPNEAKVVQIFFAMRAIEQSAGNMMIGPRDKAL